MREKKSVEDNHGDALTEDNAYGNNLKTKKRRKRKSEEQAQINLYQHTTCVLEA